MLWPSRGLPPQGGGKYLENGCVYSAKDMPGKFGVDVFFSDPKLPKDVAIEYELNCRFVMNIINTCCGLQEVVVGKQLDVSCSTVFTLDEVNKALKRLGKLPIRK